MRPTATAAYWMRVALLLALLACLSLPAWGQGCALCYTQAAGAGLRMIRALKSGILILIFPPLSISIGALVMSYRKRNLFGEPSNTKRKADPGSDLGW
jgi:hypothetical protein